MSRALLARSLHATIMNDLSVTTDERSSPFVNDVTHSDASVFRGALAPTSINRQVRLGDFLFTGE
jgi:hypothetical protein